MRKTTMQSMVHAMAKDTGGDLRLRLQAPAVVADQDGKGAKPEKQLNSFVRVVVLIERVGNAIGTLAFTWATVVLLGGYPTVLGPYDDFLFATTIVFLEAVRMFMSRNNKLDYQLFFRTKGAVRPLGWNGLIVLVYLCSMLMQLLKFDVSLLLIMLLLITPAVLGLLNSSRAINLLPTPVCYAMSHYSPLVATILPVPLLVRYIQDYPENNRVVALWTVLFVLLFSFVLLLTISRLRFQRAIKMAKHVVGTNSSKQVFWHRLLLNICMFVELVMLVLMAGSPRLSVWVLGYNFYALLLVSFANLQIPAAIVRVVLPLWSLKFAPHDYGQKEKYDDAKTNLASSLTVFYVMVLGQGILYIVACFLEIFSFIPRRILAHRGGLRGQWGVQTVNLYYAYALEKYMEKDVLAPKEINLRRFAMDSINSESPKMQLLGVQMVHNLLQREPARMQLLSKLNASRKMVSRIVGMLGWTRPEYRVIRLFSAKLVAELAKSLPVATISGMMQNVSSLLDADGILEREHTLLDTDDEEEQKQDILVTDVRNIQEERHVLAMGPYGNLNQGNRLNPFRDTSSSLETESHSTHEVGVDKNSSCFLGCLKWMSTLWSTSHEEKETLTQQDYLPALGLLILENLCCDQNNYMDIIRQAGLIPKIIGFTSYKNYAKNVNEEQQQTLMRSSLKLLKRLSKTDGEIGITLRYKISEHPLLLMNLADILDDRFSSQGVRKLVIGILRNLALNADVSQEIGCMQLITRRLMDAFLKRAAPSSKSSKRCLQKVAGQALAMLTMESAHNCKAVMMEAGSNVIGELASMIYENNRKYVAARLLVNLFHNMQPDLSNFNLMKLCEVLPKVLDTILDAKTEGAELEVMIGLSSQMCKVIPEDFARELENGHHKDMFVKKLVDMLNENMKPTVDCPGIRRVIIEQAIYLMTCCSSCYANGFNENFMMEALLMVEKTPSRVERYRLFLGNTGIMEHKQSLNDLVAAAKELLCHQ